MGHSSELALFNVPLYIQMIIPYAEAYGTNSQEASGDDEPQRRFSRSQLQ